MDGSDSDRFGPMTLRQWGGVATIAVVLLASAVPYGLHQRTYDSAVAAATVAAVASMWAAIFTLESLRDLARTRRAELEANLIPTVEYVERRAGVPSVALAVANLGKASAFDVSIRFAVRDADGDYIGPFAASGPSVIHPGTVERFKLNDTLSYIGFTNARIPGIFVEIHSASPIKPNGSDALVEIRREPDQERYTRHIQPSWCDTGSRLRKVERLMEFVRSTLQQRGLNDVAVTAIPGGCGFIFSYCEAPTDRLRGMDLNVTFSGGSVRERFLDVVLPDIIKLYEDQRESRALARSLREKLHDRSVSS